MLGTDCNLWSFGFNFKINKYLYILHSLIYNKYLWLLKNNKDKTVKLKNVEH